MFGVLLFTESAPRLIQTISHNIHVSVSLYMCLCHPAPQGARLLVKVPRAQGHIGATCLGRGPGRLRLYRCYSSRLRSREVVSVLHVKVLRS